MPVDDRDATLAVLAAGAAVECQMPISVSSSRRHEWEGEVVGPTYVSGKSRRIGSGLVGRGRHATVYRKECCIALGEYCAILRSTQKS